MQIVFDFGKEHVVENVVVNSSIILVTICFRYQIFQKVFIFLESGAEPLGTIRIRLRIPLAILGLPEPKTDSLLFFLFPLHLHLLLHLLREKLVGFLVELLGNLLNFPSSGLDLRVVICISSALFIIVIFCMEFLLILIQITHFGHFCIIIALKSWFLGPIVLLRGKNGPFTTC